VWLRDQWPEPRSIIAQLLGQEKRKLAESQRRTKFMGQNREYALLIHLLQKSVIQNDALVVPETVKVGLKTEVRLQSVSYKAE